MAAGAVVIPKASIAVETDVPGEVGIHTDLPPNQAPPAPTTKIKVSNAGQKGLPVLAYGKKVAVEGGTGDSNSGAAKHCPAGTFEITHGMLSVKVAGTPTAFLELGQILHCEKLCKVGPGPNTLKAGPGNEETVLIGGKAIVGRSFAYKGFSLLTAEQQAQVRSVPGEVIPAPMDGSDEGARTADGDGDQDGEGGAAEDPNATDAEANRWYEFEAVLLVNGVAYSICPDLTLRITGPGASYETSFDAITKSGRVGPFAAGTTNVTVTVDGATVQVQADTSTTEGT